MYKRQQSHTRSVLRDYELIVKTVHHVFTNVQHGASYVQRTVEVHGSLFHHYAYQVFVVHVRVHESRARNQC